MAQPLSPMLTGAPTHDSARPASHAGSGSSPVHVADRPSMVNSNSYRPEGQLALGSRARVSPFAQPISVQGRGGPSRLGSGCRHAEFTASTKPRARRAPRLFGPCGVLFFSCRTVQGLREAMLPESTGMSGRELTVSMSLTHCASAIGPSSCRSRYSKWASACR
jgi:hypothetical protein